MKTLSTFLIIVALTAGMAGCGEVSPPLQYDLAISSTEGGSVTSPGEGTATYDEGRVVDLVAETEEGYRFVNWTGDVGGIANVSSAVTTITISDDYEITANFAYGPAIPLKNPNDFVQMTIQVIGSLNPLWLDSSGSVEQLQYVYETLLSYKAGSTDEFVSVLATEWKLLDDVTYRFKVREGVKFHEGGTLTAEDVEYSLEQALVLDSWLFVPALLGLVSIRDGDGNILLTFDQIDSVVEADGDWVIFRLSDPAWGPVFLQMLCCPWGASIVDKEWCILHSEWDGTEETWTEFSGRNIRDSYLYDHTNGTGPWKLEESDPGVSITLVKNDNYWNGPVPFNHVITKVVDEWAIRKAALLAGDADFVYVPRANIGELEGIADLKVYQDLPGLAADAFFFNMAINPDSTYSGSGALDGEGIPTDFFTDMDVRKGFNYAFDWETYIKDAAAGDGKQIGSPIIEGLPFYNPDASMYGHDLTKAEEHLKLAWDGEVWDKGFKFTLLYNIGSLARETACKILAENLYAINPKFQVSILPTDWGNGIGPILRARILPMFLVGWAVDYPHPHNFLVPFMASYGFFADRQGYGSAELDELIDDAFKEPNPAMQKDMYYGLQERYYEDAPSIMLIQPLDRCYFTRYIHGFYANPVLYGLYSKPLYYMSKSSS